MTGTADGILARFAGHAKARPDDVAIADGGPDGSGDWTFRRVLGGVSALARELRATGVQAGDVVLFRAANGPWFSILDLAVLACRAVPACLPERLTEGDLATVLAGVRPTVVVDVGAVADPATAAVTRHGVTHVRLTPDDLVRLAGRPAGEADGPVPAGGWHGSPAAVVFTSGSTGAPRGVVLEEAAVLAGLTDWCGRWATGHPWRLRTMSYLPMSHVAERIMSHYLMCLYGTSVHVGSAATLGRDLAAARPHVVFGVPHVWAGLTTELTSPTARSLRQAVYDIRQAVNGGARQLAGTAGRLRAHGLLVANAYGMTETTVPAFFQLTDDGSGRIGDPVGVQHQIAYDGELLIRSPYAPRGYADRWPAVRPVTDEQGWIHTGDLAEESSGEVRVVGRAAVSLKTARGQFVSPEPIESYLMHSSEVANACLLPTVHGDRILAVVSCPAAADWPALDIERYERSLLAALKGAWRRGEVPYGDVNRVVVVPDRWVPETGLTTPNHKLNRAALRRRYRVLLSAGDGQK